MLLSLHRTLTYIQPRRAQRAPQAAVTTANSELGNHRTHSFVMELMDLSAILMVMDIHLQVAACSVMQQQVPRGRTTVQETPVQ